MKTKVHNNSIETYHDLIESGKLSQSEAKVLKAISDLGEASIANVMHFTGMQKSDVSARMNKLRAKNALVYTGTRKSVTGKIGDFWKATVDGIDISKKPVDKKPKRKQIQEFTLSDAARMMSLAARSRKPQNDKQGTLFAGI